MNAAKQHEIACIAFDLYLDVSLLYFALKHIDEELEHVSILKQVEKLYENIKIIQSEIANN